MRALIQIISTFAMLIGYNLQFGPTAREMFEGYYHKIEWSYKLLLDMWLHATFAIWAYTPLGGMFALYRMTRERGIKVFESFNFNGIILIIFFGIGVLFAALNNPISMFLYGVIMAIIAIYLLGVFFYYAWDVYSVYSRKTQIILTILTAVFIPYAGWILYFVSHRDSTKDEVQHFEEKILD